MSVLAESPPGIARNGGSGGNAGDEYEREAALAAVAVALVDRGRFVPGITVAEDGRARSWWWPLPAAEDRAPLRALLDGSDADAHRALAHRLASLVDTEVRARLVAEGCELVPRRSGRRGVPEAWLLSLTEPDPWLRGAAAPDRLRAFEATVNDWVSSGRPLGGSVRLCLRIVEPSFEDDLSSSSGKTSPKEQADAAWYVELLAQDVDEPSLVVPASQVWSGRSALGRDGVESLLAGLGRLARIAPELEPLLHEARPTAAELDGDAVLTLVRERSATLADAGIALLLPSWWVRRRRVGLRASARSKAKPGTSATTSAGVGLDQLVQFRWEAALGDDKLTKRELNQLAAAAAAKTALVRVRGQWLELHPGEIDAVLARAGTTGEASARDLLRSSLGIGEPDALDLPDDVELAGVTATGWLGKLLDGALHQRLEAVPTPDGFEGCLRPYQERGVGWLRFLGSLGLGACLADDMGLGKTAQLVATLLADPPAGPTLVICPVSVLGNWARELERFAPELAVLIHHGAGRHRDHDEPFAERACDHDVVLTTYALAARDSEQLNEVAWERLVLDEAQQVKNPATAQAKAVRQMHAGRRVALTGTPVENRLSELWSIMSVCNPGLLGTATEFRRRFSIPIEREGDTETADRLRRIITPFVLRRLKTDRSIISDLPDKIETTDHCALTREQASLYQAVVDDLLAAAEDEDGMARRGAVLAGLTKLKQVCNHPAHLLGDGTPLAGRSGKLTRVEELLDELLDAGDRALAFTQFRTWGDRLEPYLARRFGVPVLWLHGGVHAKRRDKLVDQFQSLDGPGIMLISLRAGGTGLNLTAASHVIHLDRWWNPAVEDQATDRAFRIGQHRNVMVHKLVTAGTVEERIDEIIAGKRALADAVVGAGEDWLTELSTEALADIVSLRDTEMED